MARRINKQRSLRVHALLLGVGLFFNVAALLLLWWDGSRSAYIDTAFSYNADIIEAESAYDKDRGLFVGASYVTANLQLMFGETDDGPTITSKLSKESDDGRVQDLERKRKVDPITGQYIAEKNEKEGEGGYVFAPKGLTKDATFFYRHITYDAPALMRFVGEETFDGLTVYRYKADYSNAGRIRAESNNEATSSADQVLEYTPDLQIWVEPISGWMVKYRDDSTLNSYDQKTNSILQPVRHFSSITSDASVDQHVAYAKTLRLKAVFINQIAPSIFVLVILLVLFAIALMRLKSPKAVPIHAALVVITVAPAIILAGWLTGIQPLVTLFIDRAGVNPLGALCFIFVGLAIIARHNKKSLIMAFLGGVILIVAFLQVLGSMSVLPFQIDLLLFKNTILSFNEALPTRMSPYEAFTFLVLGVVLVKAGLTTSRTPFHFARFGAGIVVALGVFGILLQFLQVDKAFTITFIQSLSVVSSLLFVICGFTLLQFFRQLRDSPDDVKSMLHALMWPSLATVPLIIIGMFAQVQQNVVRQDLQTNFNKTISEVENVFATRMDIYSNTLTGTRGLFASSQEVTEDEWRSFISTYQLPTTFPGLRALGYAKITSAQATQVRASAGAQPIAILPDKSNESVRAPIVYIEPKTKIAAKYIGRNLFSDPVLSEVLKEVRDDGKARLSGRFVDPDIKDTDGVDALLVAPIYKRGLPITTVAERQVAIEGYAFGAVHVGSLVESAISNRASDVDFEIYDGIDIKSDALMYRRHPESSGEPRLTEKTTLFLAEQPWTIVYAAQPGFRLSPEEEFSPTLLLVGGSFAYFAVIAIAYLLVDLNRRMKLLRDDKAKRGR